MRLEKKLEQLAACGVSLRAGLDNSILTEEWAREDLEEDGSYNLLLSVLGGPDGADEPGFCDALYYFDTELGSLPGQYSEIVQRVAKLSKGALQVEPFEDEVDFGPCSALLEFNCNGQPVRISFQQEDDWFNWTVMDRLVTELKKLRKDLSYFVVDMDGQDVITGCLAPGQIKKLAALGVAVQVLEGNAGPQGPRTAELGRSGHEAAVERLRQGLEKPKPWWQRLFGK